MHRVHRKQLVKSVEITDAVSCPSSVASSSAGRTQTLIWLQSQDVDAGEENCAHFQDSGTAHKSPCLFPFKHALTAWFPLYACPQVGIQTLYNFWAFPAGSRLRLSQVLVMPSYQAAGLGKKLLALAYSMASGKGCMDLTVGRVWGAPLLLHTSRGGGGAGWCQASGLSWHFTVTLVGTG